MRTLVLTYAPVVQAFALIPSPQERLALVREARTRRVPQRDPLASVAPAALLCMARPAAA